MSKNQKNIKFFDLKKQLLFIKKNIKKEVEKVIESGWYLLGNELLSFEKQFSKFLNAKFCVGVNSGTDALIIALLSLNLKKGDEVITTSNTFIATALAISKAEASPVFIDIEKHSFQIDINDLEKKITKKTKAIIIVHLYGEITKNIKKIQKIAKKNNLFLIEDACQAHDASLNGKKAGTFGDIGCFSFYPTKNLGCYGDGGAITTNSKKLFEKCLLLRNYGQKIKYYHSQFGFNSRLDEIQAAILKVKLKYLKKWNAKRLLLAKKYIRNLSGLKEIILPEIKDNSSHVFHLFVIKAKKRNELKKFLEKNGIETMIHYPIPIHKQKVYKNFNSLKLSETEKATKEILSLPLYPEMNVEEVNYVSRKILEFYDKE